MEIRTAETDDMKSIFNLITELEESELNKDDFETVFLDNLGCSQVYYYVAVDNKEIIGFISVHIQKLLHHVANIAEIQELIVTKQFQGRGVGKQLFEKAKEIAIANRCTQVEVCCGKKRISSHAFYEHQGMRNSHYKFCLSLNN